MAGEVSARRGTKMLAPPSRDTAVGRAQPTSATADRRGGLGEDSTAKTNPFRAVEACGRGSKSSSQGTPKTSAPLRKNARSIMPVNVQAIFLEEVGNLGDVSTPSPRTSPTAARRQGGQIPLAPEAGALRPPPGCGLATTLPRHTGGVWLVGARLLHSTARARGGQAPLASRMGTPCSPPHCSRTTALSLPASDAWLISRRSRRNVTSLYGVHLAATNSAGSQSPAAIHGVAVTEQVVLEAAVGVPLTRVAALVEHHAAAKPPGPSSREEQATVCWAAAPSAALRQPCFAARDAAAGAVVGRWRASTNAAAAAALVPNDTCGPLGRRG